MDLAHIAGSKRRNELQFGAIRTFAFRSVLGLISHCCHPTFVDGYSYNRDIPRESERDKYAMTKLRLLMICFCTAIPIAIAAPATAFNIPSSFLMYNNSNSNNNASSHSLVTSPTTFSLSNSTTKSWDSPPDPWVGETTAGGKVILEDYGSATWLDPYEWEADMGDVLVQARAEAIGRTRSSVITRRLDYAEEHAYFYVRPLMSGVTWDIWLAALDQITVFHRGWKDYTFYFRIVQPTRDGGMVTVVLADGQLRVLL